MAMLTVEGVFRDGRIELDEVPPGVGPNARVVVTFLATEPDADARERLRRQAFDRMERGLHLGGGPYPRRDELYDRFDR